MAITTSITVSFRNPALDAAQGLFKAEIDTRADGFNGGNSTFPPGTPVGILVFVAQNLRVIDARSSSGGLSRGSDPGVFWVGSDNELDDREYVAFDYENREQQLSYPVLGSFSADWVGGPGLGAARLINSGTTVAVDVTDERDVGLLELRYRARFELWILRNAALTAGEVYCKFWAETT